MMSTPLGRVGGLVIRSKDPIIVTFQAIPASNYNVRLSTDRVSVADDDVVVLDDKFLDPVEQF